MKTTSFEKFKKFRIDEDSKRMIQGAGTCCDSGFWSSFGCSQYVFWGSFFGSQEYCMAGSGSGRCGSGSFVCFTMENGALKE